jgi:MFS family permease
VTPAVDSSRFAWWRSAVGVLAGALLFNLGQGVLRPTMPLYLQQVFSANYRMVTAIPTVFGAGKWVASLPTGYLLVRLGRRPLMVGGLLVIALSDVASVMTSAYGVFLGFRAMAGVGWAMFGTVATATMVDLPAAQRRGRAVSLLMMSETAGLLLGTAAGGWLYQGLGVASPFVFEAACLLAGAPRGTLGVAPASRGSRPRFGDRSNARSVTAPAKPRSRRLAFQHGQGHRWTAPQGEQVSARQEQRARGIVAIAAAMYPPRSNSGPSPSGARPFGVEHRRGRATRSAGPRRSPPR